MMLLRGHCLSPDTSAGRSAASRSLLVSPGDAFNCNVPAFTSRRFLCLCAEPTPLYVSRAAAPAGSAPVCGCGALRMWFLWKRRSVAGAGASQRPEAAAALRCQLRVRSSPSPPRGRARAAAGRGMFSHRHPALPPRHGPPPLSDAGTELGGSLPADESSQLSPASFPGLVFCHVNEW